MFPTVLYFYSCTSFRVLCRLNTKLTTVKDSSKLHVEYVVEHKQ